MENLDQIEKAIKAVIKETAWSITWETLDAIKAYRGGIVREDNDYQFGWAYGSCNGTKPAGIKGSCGYGSQCIVSDNFCSMSTCGGHGVEIKIQGDEVIFTPDAHESAQSWGDAHGESEDFPINDETRRYRRIQRLKKALEN